MNSEDFRRALSPYPPSGLVFVGLGNPMRRDDGAGPVFLDRLAASKWFPASHFIDAGVNPENHLQHILDAQPEAVVLIDSARFPAPPGTIAWLEREALDRIRISTHAFSMVLVENYLKAQREMDFYYLAIRPESTDFTEGLTRSVRNGIEQFFGKSVAPGD